MITCRAKPCFSTECQSLIGNRDHTRQRKLFFYLSGIETDEVVVHGNENVKGTINVDCY